MCNAVLAAETEDSREQTFVIVMVSILPLVGSSGNKLALGITIFGKSDAGWTHWCIWNIEEYSESCPITSTRSSYFQANRHENLPQSMEYLQLNEVK